MPPVDSPRLAISRSLYDIGLDINCGPQTLDPLAFRVLSPKSSLTSWIRIAESSAKVSRVPRVALDPEYEVGQKSLKHPQTEVPIIEETLLAEVTPATSSPAPNMSDLVPEITQTIKRVMTVDNVDKGKRPGHWSPVRPPSIYPNSVTPSPSERSMDEDRAIDYQNRNEA